MVGEQDLLDTPDAGPAAIRGATLRVGSYVVGALLSVASGALLFRHLGVIGVGRYTIVLSLVALVSGLSDAGLTSIGMRELSVQGGAERRALASDLLGLRIVISVVGVVGMFVFALLAGYPNIVVAGVLIGGVGLVLQSYQSTLSVSLLSRLRLGWVSVIGVVSQATSVVLIALLVLDGAHLLAFVAVTIPATAVALAITVVKVRGDVPLVPTVHRERWRRLLRMVLPYSVAVTAAAIYLQISVVLVSLIANERQLGLYSASFRIVLVLMAIPGPAGRLGVPDLCTRRTRRRCAARLRGRSRLPDQPDPGRLDRARDRDRGTARNPDHHRRRKLQGRRRRAFDPGTGTWSDVCRRRLGERSAQPPAPARHHVFQHRCAHAGCCSGGCAGQPGRRCRRRHRHCRHRVHRALVAGIIVVRGDPRLKPSLASLPRVALAGACGAAPALLGTPVIVKLILSSAIYAAGLVVLRLIPDELRAEVRRLRIAG